MCLPRSLAVAYAHAVREQIRSGQLHSYYRTIRKIRARAQKRAAEELLNLAKVQVPPVVCSLEEFHRFQIFFAERDTAIVVYFFQKFWS